jgi:hypothetical protein
MPGGAEISVLAAQALSLLAVVATPIVTSDQVNTQDIQSSSVPYRAPQQNNPAVYSITETTPSSSSTTVVGGQQLTQQISSVSTMYVFDAVLQANHDRKLTPTKQPLQTGYNIADHAVLQQAVVVLEIGMSDAMAAFSPGMWSGNSSKSVSAYQTIVSLMENRQLLTLSTRQQTYQNMMITGIESPETNKTFRSLKARITFTQIYLVTVASQIQSARPNATDSTQLATVQPAPVPASVTQQNTVSGIDPTVNYGAAGDLSSNPMIVTGTDQGVNLP